MKWSVSQSVTMPRIFAEDVRAAGESGCANVEVWLTKLEQHLETATVEQTQSLIAEYRLSLVAASYQGGLLLSQGEQRQAHFDHFKRRLALCEQFQIPTLVLVGDFAVRVDATSLQRAVVSLTQACQWAAGFNVKLALEFRGGDTFCNCLETAVMLVEQTGEPNLGVCLDAFHYYKGPSKPEDLAKLTTKNLAHVQLCDIVGVPRELMTDSDRILPGDGDFDLATIMQHLKRIDYDSAVSVELFNPMLWDSEPTQLIDMCMTAAKRL